MKSMCKCVSRAHVLWMSKRKEFGCWMILKMRQRITKYVGRSYAHLLVTFSASPSS